MGGKGKDKEIPLRRINQGGGTFITPLFPTPNPSREVKATLILKKYSAGFVEMDSMEGFTFKPKNGPTLSGKREHSRLNNVVFTKEWRNSCDQIYKVGVGSLELSDTFCILCFFNNKL